MPIPLTEETDRHALIDEQCLQNLVRGVAVGDSAALVTLFERTGAQLLRIARRRLRCHDDAEELLWDIFVCVWKSAAVYDVSRGTVIAWLRTIAINRCIDRLRSRRRTVSLNDSRYSSILGALRSDWMEPEERQHQDEASSSIQRALQSLSPLRRRIVNLAFFTGLAHTEVARTVGLPLGTVKSHLRRGLASLRAPLQHLNLAGATPQIPQLDV